MTGDFSFVWYDYIISSDLVLAYAQIGFTQILSIAHNCFTPYLQNMCVAFISLTRVYYARRRHSSETRRQEDLYAARSFYEVAEDQRKQV